MAIRYEAIDNFKNALECLPILRGLVDWYHCAVYGSFARYMFECKEVGFDQVDEFLTHSDIDVKVCIKKCASATKMFVKLFKYLSEQGAVVEFAGQVYPIHENELKLDLEVPWYMKGYWMYGNYFVWVPYGSKYIKIDLYVYTQRVDPIEYYDFTVNNFLFYRLHCEPTKFKYFYELEKPYKINTMEDLDNRAIMPMCHKDLSPYSLVKRLFRSTKLWKLGYRIRTEEAKQAMKLMYEEGRKYTGPIYIYKTYHNCPSQDSKEICVTKYEKDKITMADIEQMPEFTELLRQVSQ